MRTSRLPSPLACSAWVGEPMVAIGSGGTELLPALRTALAMPADDGRARSFVVVTDGYVTIEKEAFELVRASLGKANLFAFGIGSSVNRLLIEGLARAGKGEPFFVLNAQPAEAEAARLRAMIEQPLLTRIRVKFDGFDAYDLDVPQVPDLFARRPIVVTGRFRGKARGRIEIEGLAAGGAVLLPIDVERAAVRDDTPALRYLWARGRIAELGDFNRLGRDHEAVREITRLGLAHNLLTDYTSFIAVDQVVRNPGGSATPVEQPLPLPQGVSNLAVGQVPSTPEPEFALLAALAGGLLWWQRRRRGVRRG
jgi:Ca-activated chloride channel family protein